MSCTRLLEFEATSCNVQYRACFGCTLKKSMSHIKAFSELCLTVSESKMETICMLNLLAPRQPG